MLAHSRRSTPPLFHAIAAFSSAPDGPGWILVQAGGRGGDTALRVDPLTASVTPLPLPQRPASLSTRRAPLAAALESTFLPAGHPTSVAAGYLRFVGWQAAHHAAAAANGVLASTFLLYGVGLGAGAIPTAGALNWVLKDGLGQAGTLLFGRAMAHNFDVASRGWYVAASGKLSAAMALEIATAAAPGWFLPLAAAANAVKGLAWMAGGSARSAFNVAFAADRNIADVTAKATSQTICSSLIGTAAGMAVAAGVGQSVPAAFGCYAALAAVHLATAAASAAAVPLATLNPSRLSLLASLVVQQLENGTAEGFRLPTPAEAAPLDSAGLTPWRWRRHAAPGPLPELRAGVCLQTYAARHPQRAAALLPVFRGRKWVLLPDGGAWALVLHETAGTADAVAAALQAAAWERRRAGGLDAAAAEETAAAAEAAAPAAVAAMAAAGWDTRGVVLEPRKRRARW